MVSFTHSVLSETVSPQAAQGGKHPFLWFNFKDTLEIKKESPAASGGKNGGTIPFDPHSEDLSLELLPRP